MKFSKALFLTIFVVGFLLRVVGIGSTPPSITWDEVAWGYNAYSIGIDGKDEFGKFLPIQYIESFGDFKPPLYMYLAVLPVKLFGLNEFSTRLPSATTGSLAVALTYFLVKEIFRRDNERLALLSSFILAISPWHIMLSRAAFEANVAVFFIMLGIFFFLKATKQKSWLLLISIISFVLSTYAFNSARIVAPIIFIILFIVFWRKMLMEKKVVMVSGFVGLLLFFPLLAFLTTPQAALRFNEVNILSDISIINKVNQQVEHDKNAFWSKIIHNRRFTFGVEYIHHYFDNLTPKFLFIKGDGNPKFSIQDVGQLYVWEIPFLVIGALMLFRKKEGNWWIVPTMLIVGIIPAGFARETPHALRIENTIPSFQILTAYGLLATMSFTVVEYRKIPIRKLFIFCVSMVIVFNLIYFLHNYINHYSREFSGEWQYGYKEAVEYVKNNSNKYRKIYVTESLGRPYIYFLFFENYEPKKFRNEARVEREVLGFVHVKSYGKYEFVKKPSYKLREGGDVLFITTPGEVPGNAFIVKEFNLLNGKPSLVAFTL